LGAVRPVAEPVATIGAIHATIVGAGPIALGTIPSLLPAPGPPVVASLLPAGLGWAATVALSPLTIASDFARALRPAALGVLAIPCLPPAFTSRPVGRALPVAAPVLWTISALPVETPWPPQQDRFWRLGSDRFGGGRCGGCAGFRNRLRSQDVALSGGVLRCRMRRRIYGNSVELRRIGGGVESSYRWLESLVPAFR
jgi:hypothetical protein